MSSRAARRPLIAAVGGLIGLFTLAGNVRAESCGVVRYISPGPGEAFPEDGLIWDVCYVPYAATAERRCPPPSVRDPSGRELQLVLVREVQSSFDLRVVSAYRPLPALSVGSGYQLQESRGIGDVGEDSEPYSFDVVPPRSELPPRPEVDAVDYWVNGDEAVARFAFRPFSGLLAVDSGGFVDEPIEGLESLELAMDGVQTFRLGWGRCGGNLMAGRGSTAQVSFGVMDPAGRFSGWTEPENVTFPSKNTVYPELAVEEPEPSEHTAPSPGWCSVKAPGSASRPLSLFGLALAVAAAQVRRGSSAGAR